MKKPKKKGQMGVKSHVVFDILKIFDTIQSHCGDAYHQTRHKGDLHSIVPIVI